MCADLPSSRVQIEFHVCRNENISLAPIETTIAAAAAVAVTAAIQPGTVSAEVMHELRAASTLNVILEIFCEEDLQQRRRYRRQHVTENNNNKVCLMRSPVRYVFALSIYFIPREFVMFRTQNQNLHFCELFLSLSLNFYGCSVRSLPPRRSTAEQQKL